MKESDMISIEELRDAWHKGAENDTQHIAEKGEGFIAAGTNNGMYFCAIAIAERLDKLIELSSASITKRNFIHLPGVPHEKACLCGEPYLPNGSGLEPLYCHRCLCTVISDLHEEYPAPDGHDARLEADEKLDQEMRDAGRR